MTKSEIMKAAHAEAREIVASKRISYAEALKFGLRRVYNDLLTARNVAIIAAQAETPKFMWLRGW
jgi:hypothetical protein